MRQENENLSTNYPGLPEMMHTHLNSLSRLSGTQGLNSFKNVIVNKINMPIDRSTGTVDLSNR